MNKRTVKQLSPIQKIVRNAVANYLFKSGFSINFIADIMRMPQSTVSRIVRRTDVLPLRDITGLSE